jgi:hypothetical protein
MNNLITPSRWLELSPFSTIRYLSFFSGIIAFYTVMQWNWVESLGSFGFYVLLIVFYAGPLVSVDTLEQDTRKKIEQLENHISHLQTKINEITCDNSVSNLQMQLEELEDNEYFYKAEIKRLKARVNNLLKS